MNNILITGSNGFIGKHLKEYLKEKYPNYRLLCPSSNELDLLDEKKVDEFIIQNKPNVIIHLANRGGDRKTADMQNIVEYNLRIFFNIAKYDEKGIKIITLGSGAEYGKQKPIVKAKENDDSYLALDPYGFYKQIVSKCVARSKNITHLRIFGVYGAYEDYNYRFISNSVIKNLLKLPITIHQNVVFDYIYIDDMLKMIDYVLHHEMKYKIYNASRGESVDLVQIVNIINSLSDFKSKIIVLNEGFNNEYTSSNDRILDEIKPFSFTPLKAGIQNLINYFSSNLNHLDVGMIKQDKYLNKIQNMWKK